MSNDIKLTPRLEIVLKAINDYIQEFGKPPYHDNRWISERTDYESNNITNIKGDLRKFKFINDDSNLTQAGKEYIRKRFGPFVVKAVEVRVQGNVRAGPNNNIYADLNAFDIPSDQTKKIPDVSPDKDTFALVVEGQSMTELGILPGDLVIVERQDQWWPDPQDIIVTTYLPHVAKKRISDYSDSEEYVGPVLKVYVRRYGENGGELIELGWRRANELNLDVIKADDLKPVGRVIGVYRDIKKFTPNTKR